MSYPLDASVIGVRERDRNRRSDRDPLGGVGGHQQLQEGLVVCLTVQTPS
jgi:hypothetical protein